LVDLNALNLLLQEVNDEVLLRIDLAEDVLELGKVVIASHERRVQVVHELLSEFTVARLSHLLQQIVVLSEVRLDQVKLLAALHEANHLLHEVLLGLLSFGVNNFCPQFLLQLSLWQDQLTSLGNNLCFISVIVF